MLADRARLKTPIPAYRSYTLGAGVYEFKGDYTVGYDAQIWGIGSLSPTDFRDIFVGQIVGTYGTLSSFGLGISSTPPDDIFSKVEVYYGGSLIATYLRSAVSAITINGSYKNWQWNGVSNPFSAGYTYEVRIYP